MSLSEAEVQNAIFLKFGREPDVTLWRNNTGQAKAEVVTRAHLERLLSLIVNPHLGIANAAAELVRSLLNEPTRFTRYGLSKGSSDIIGIVQTTRPVGLSDVCVRMAHIGVFIALEVKAEAGGRVTPEQKMFLDIVNRRGGIGRVVHSVEQAQAAIDAARAL